MTVLDVLIRAWWLPLRRLSVWNKRSAMDAGVWTCFIGFGLARGFLTE